MPATDSVVIVGAGLAGVSAAGTLREAGFAGRVVLLSEEREAPYDRPPLSKSVLVHDEYAALVASHLPEDIALRAPENITLRPATWFDEQRIELRLATLVTRIDPAAHRVMLASGETLDYTRLILTPGARVRRLPAVESGPLETIYLRTLRDALSLRHRLRPGSRVVLLGGGVIGMEVAASAALRDCQVTVLELAPRIMSRALCGEIADFVADYHRGKGVRLRLRQASGTIHGVELQDGSNIQADVIVVGVGVVPNVALAQEAGLKCDDGIVVDAHGRTSAIDVFAAGDAVRYPDAFCGKAIRAENWMHAQNQAIVAAKNVLGVAQPYAQIPYMWSDQYDLKIQVTGRFDVVQTVRRGDPAKNKFMLLHLADSRVVGASGINESRDMKYAQRLIEARVVVDAEALADPTFNLKKAAGA
jgi:NADPH-dependent 2,4-dienoyl-CoA reductase/sulfur reductase-like enzyme